MNLIHLTCKICSKIVDCMVVKWWYCYRKPLMHKHESWTFRLGLFCFQSFETAILFRLVYFRSVLDLRGIVGNGRFVSGEEVMPKAIGQPTVRTKRIVLESSQMIAQLKLGRIRLGTYLRTAWGTKLTAKVSSGNVWSRAGSRSSGDIRTIASTGGTPTFTEINLSLR